MAGTVSAAVKAVVAAMVSPVVAAVEAAEVLAAVQAGRLETEGEAAAAWVVEAVDVAVAASGQTSERKQRPWRRAEGSLSVWNLVSSVVMVVAEERKIEPEREAALRQTVSRSDPRAEEKRERRSLGSLPLHLPRARTLPAPAIRAFHR